MSYELGIATARANQVSPEIVPLTPETAPDGTFFIGAEKGSIYQLDHWIPGGKYLLRRWMQNTLDYVRSWPEPDDLHCGTLEFHGQTEIIVIGPTPYGSALASDEVTPSPQEEFRSEEGQSVEAQPVESSPAPEEVGSPPMLPPPFDFDAGGDAAPEGDETLADDVSAPVPVSSQPSFSTPPETVPAVEETPAPDEPASSPAPVPQEGFAYPAQVLEMVQAIVWPVEGKRAVKADYIRDIARICRDTDCSLAQEDIEKWGVEKGVWPTLEAAANSVKPTLNQFAHQNPGFSYRKGWLNPPVAPEGGSLSGKTNTRGVPADAQATPIAVGGSPAEISEASIKSSLGILDAEDVEAAVEVRIKIPLRRLSPEVVKALGLSLEGVD
jgi:hypothetical protein